MSVFIEGILIKLTTTVLYDILKKVFLGEEGIKHFKSSIRDTIEYFHTQGVELKDEYFISCIEDETVKNAVGQFRDGIDYVSIDTVSRAFLKSDFYMLTEKDREETARCIIDYFVGTLKTKILSDPKINSQYLLYAMQINFKKDTEFVIELRNNLHIAHEDIKSRLIVIDSKVDGMISAQTLMHDDVRSMKNILTDFIISKEESENTPQIQTEFQIRLTDANDLFNNGLYDTARWKYLELLSKDRLSNEERWKLNRNIAMTYFITENFSHSLPYFKEAYKVLPNEDRGKLQNIYAIMIEEGEQKALEEFDKIFKEENLQDEARVLKMNLLIRLDRSLDGLSLFDEKNLENPDIRYAYSTILYQIKDYRKAEEEITKAIHSKKKPHMMLYLGIIKLTGVIEQIKKEKPLKGRYNQAIQFELQEAKKILTEVSNELEKTQSKREYATAIFNRGVANSYLGLEEESLEDFLSAQKLGLNGLSLYMNLGFSYIKLSNANKAIESFNKAYELDPDKSLPYLLDALLYNNDYPKLKSLSLQHVEYPKIHVTSENFRIYLFLCVVLNRELHFQETDDILADIERSFPNDYYFVSLKSKILWERGERILAINFLEKKRNEVIENRDVINIKLGDYYFFIHEWRRAKNIFKNYLDIDASVQLDYLRCLHYLNMYTEVIDFSLKMLEDAKLQEKDIVKEMLAYSYLSLDNVIDALPLFNELAITKCDSYFYYNWAYCESKLSNNDKARQILDKAQIEFKGKYKELISLSEMYFKIGEKQIAVNIAYEAATNLTDDFKANANYMRILSFMPNDADLVTEPQKELYKKLLDNWESKFPQNKIFYKIPVEPDLKTIREQLELKSNYGNQLMNMYESRKIPLALFSSQSGLCMFEAWKNLYKGYTTRIFAYNPTTISKQYDLITSTKKLVIDPFAFFTLYELGLHQLLTSVFAEIYFTQGILDDLIQYREELDLSSKQGRNSIYTINGKLFLNQITAEEVNKEINLIDDMIKFIKSNISGNKKIYMDARIESLIEKASVQSINLSLELNIPLLCDDSFLNDLITNQVREYKYCSSLLYIQVLLDKGYIDEIKFNRIIQKIISMNYYFVPTSSNILLQDIETVEFSKYNINKKAIDSLRDIHQDRTKTLQVVAEFIVRIFFFGELNKFTKEQWADYILNTVTMNDADSKNTLDQIFKLADILLGEFKNKIINENQIKEFQEWFSKIILFRN